MLDTIVVDLARARGPRGQEKAAASLGEACSAHGFFFVVNHGVSESLVKRVFADSERFHRLPLERKLEIRLSRDLAGYAPGSGSARANSFGKSEHPDLSASYFIQEEFALDHPDRLAKRPWVVDNQWPRDLPGFRDTMVEYFAAMVALTRRLLGLQSIALGLAPDYLPSHEAFRPSRHTLRLLHYPARDPGLPGQYGFSPHTDLGFFAILAQALPGLEFLASPGVWVEAPALEGHLLVMTGDMARFWTNDRFRTMPHRVINGNGRERYAVPFFVTPRGDVAVDCFPGCSNPENPPHYREQSTNDWMAVKWGRRVPQADAAAR